MNLMRQACVSLNGHVKWLCPRASRFAIKDSGRLNSIDSAQFQLSKRKIRVTMVFVLDNYDSFTYNLVQYMGELGAEMVIRRNDELTPAEVEALRPERIVISPGPCTPQDAGISIELIKHFAKAERRVPILGVCLGHQAIGAAFGGNVVRAQKLMHGKTSEVEHDGKTIFKGLPSAMTCTRYHSLIVSDEGLPEELEISARTADGETIMALRHRELPIEGVQFHPESVLTSNGKKLIENFLKM